VSPAAGSIVVFAKQPRAGRVKTRLCPPLDPAVAAELYACMLEDVLQTTATFARQLGLDAVLAVHPPEACAALARLAPTPFRVVRQRGAELGSRMGWAVREAAAAGVRKLLLRGSDSPFLDGSALAAALAALARADLVISPDRDGGYGLVGLRRPAAELFGHPMSTRSVLDDTLANARRLGLSHELLEPGFDIDTARDLGRLARARGPHNTHVCPRTLALMDARDLWRVTESG
jgi:rSAM/selenodomain-associated transferase 1